MLLTEKYKPKSLTQIIGNTDEVKKIITWALNWQRGKGGRPLLISGPTGVGKTALANALANQFDWHLFELNAADIRNKEHTEKTAGLASEHATLFGKTRLILIDDVDKMSSKKDKGGISAIASFIKTAKQPIILTADDLWDRKLSTLRNLCIRIELKKINQTSLKKYLKYVSEKEEMEIEEAHIHEISVISAGDVRAALNDLQARNINANRDRQINVFEALKTVFKSTEYSEARKASFNANIDHDMFKLWIDENIPREYEKMEDLADAYDYLSRADVFDGRIYRRQYWGFLRYSTDLMTAGVSLSKKDVYRKFTGYAFPSYIKKMGSSKSKRASNKQIAKKLKKHIHGSTKKIVELFPTLALILQIDIINGLRFYGLDTQEAAYIMGISEAKVKTLIRKAEKEQTKEKKPQRRQKSKKQKTAKKDLQVFF